MNFTYCSRVLNGSIRSSVQTLEEAEDFQDAVLRLSKIPIITEVYYIVGGAQAGEGAVITRNRAGPADIWPLDPLNGGWVSRELTTLAFFCLFIGMIAQLSFLFCFCFRWFRIETNFDHWVPNPGKDKRR